MAYIENGTESVSISSKLIETVISEQTKFKGSVTTEQSIRIDGYFEGEINTTDTVIVTENGEFKGNVKCKEFQIYGKGSGTAVCESLCHLTDTGSFEGDITTAALVTVRGSKLNGKVQITG